LNLNQKTNKIVKDRKNTEQNNMNAKPENDLLVKFCRSENEKLDFNMLTIEELLTIYKNYEDIREEIRMHLHVRLMYKPYKMYDNVMSSLNNMNKC
jgi:hypothetical protein